VFASRLTLKFAIYGLRGQPMRGRLSQRKEPAAATIPSAMTTAHKLKDDCAGPPAATVLEDSTPPQDWGSASVTEAQDKARTWADRALELSEAGELERAAVAEVQAEIWLTRMLTLQRQLRTDLGRERRRPASQYRDAGFALATHAPVRRDRRKPLSAIPSMDRSTIANSVVLRTWKRPAS
jgi:hypothetical protein